MTRDEKILLLQHGSLSVRQSLSTLLSMSMSAKARARSKGFAGVSNLFRLALADDPATASQTAKRALSRSVKLSVSFALIATAGFLVWQNSQHGGTFQSPIGGGVIERCK